MDLQANADGNLVASVEADLRQAVSELNLGDQLQVERVEGEELPDGQ